MLALIAFGVSHRTSLAQTVVTLDKGQTYQTFKAWEATAVLLGTAQEHARRFELFDRLYQDAGVTRLRIGVFAGDENTTRSMERFLSGEIDMDGWRAQRFATVNDDDDPFHINPAGFDFYDLDWKIDNTVLPMLERARARGVRLELNLNYVAFTKQIVGGAYIHTNPEEYAEFILAVFLHLKQKYGLVPDYLEPLLEPDNSPHWDPVTLGRAVKAAMQRLDHAGFHPGLILPSVADASQALVWLDGIAQTPGALNGLSEISYHRYKGAKPRVLKAIAARAADLGVATGMLEYWFGKATHDLLFQDLTLANVSSWQPRAAFSFHRIADDGQLVLEDEIRLDRLYFVAIRPGDQRIGASSSNPSVLNPVAFRKPDGGISVVIETQGPASGIVSDLPEGDYLIETAIDGAGGSGPDSGHVGPEGTLAVVIPGPGVISIRPAE